MVMLVALAFAPTIIQGIRGETQHTTTVQVLVLDTTGGHAAPQLATAAEATAAADSELTFVAAAGAADALRARVSQGKADALLVVSRDGAGDLSFAYETKQGERDATAQRVAAAARVVELQDRLARAGITPTQYQQIAAPVPFAILATEPAPANAESATQKNARLALAYVLAIVMYMAVLLYGTWVAQGVVEEKSNRVMEIIVNAATPRELLAGKVLGIGAAALTQFVAILAAAVAFSLQGRVAQALFGERQGVAALDLSGLSLRAAGAFLVFFVLGFLLYAALYAAAGSTVSRQEDVNQVIAPLTFLVMFGFFGAIYALNAPDGTVARVLALIPFASPIVMLTRVIAGHPPWWEVGLALALLGGTAVLAVALAARIYRVGVLLYGARPSLRALLRPTQQVAR